MVMPIWPTNIFISITDLFFMPQTWSKQVHLVCLFRSPQFWNIPVYICIWHNRILSFLFLWIAFELVEFPYIFCCALLSDILEFNTVTLSLSTYFRDINMQTRDMNRKSLLFLKPCPTIYRPFSQCTPGYNLLCESG